MHAALTSCSAPLTSLPTQLVHTPSVWPSSRLPLLPNCFRPHPHPLLRPRPLPRPLLRRHPRSSPSAPPLRPRPYRAPLQRQLPLLLRARPRLTRSPRKPPSLQRPPRSRRLHPLPQRLRPCAACPPERSPSGLRRCLHRLPLSAPCVTPNRPQAPRPRPHPHLRPRPLQRPLLRLCPHPLPHLPLWRRRRLLFRHRRTAPRPHRLPTRWSDFG